MTNQSIIVIVIIALAIGGWMIYDEIQETPNISETEGVVSVRIVGYPTNEIIPNAVVTISELEYTKSTNSSGEADFVHVPYPATYNFEVTAQGWRFRIFALEIDQAMTYPHFVLQPA